MNGIDLILLGVIGITLLSKTSIGANLNITDKFNSIKQDLMDALEEVKAANQEAEQTDTPAATAPATSTTPTATAPATSTAPAASTTAQKEAKVSIYEANYMKNSLATTSSDRNFNVRMGFYNFYVQDGKMYQNGLIAIHNKSDILKVIEYLIPSIPAVQTTQTGAGVSYSKLPFHLAIALNDKVYNVDAGLIPVYKAEHVTFALNKGSIYYVPFTVEIDNSLTGAPFIVSNDIANAPVYLNMKLNFVSGNGAQNYEYEFKLPLSDWNSGSPNYYQF